MNTAEIISELITAYHPNIIEGDDSIMDDIVTELPFASELVHLETLPKIMLNLSGRDFYKNITEIVKNSYMVSTETENDILTISRNNVINNIHAFAANQITAEGNGTFGVLMTESIQNLIRKYKNSIPNTVIMGAKGSGKTFLYREILRDQYWERFVERMSKKEPEPKGLSGGECILTVPLLASGNAGGFPEVIKNAIVGYNQCGTKGKISNSVYVDSKDMLLMHVRKDHDILEWKEIWKKVILSAFDKTYQSLAELEEELQYKHIKTVFLLDGLEEIFEHTISSENEKNAIRALCRDLVDEVKIVYHNVGLMIFLRKDMARDIIKFLEKATEHVGKAAYEDRYYLPEIIRHALKFKYEKGARPEVLSLLLK